ncbi:MAG TPA: ABC transporter substrate-binding protein, partial [Candidatus Limnocylindrales bacterium]|nr:ABC transporter substrate-binding protein [Candidatus Limnocylindrales bacterium]
MTSRPPIRRTGGIRGVAAALATLLLVAGCSGLQGQGVAPIRIGAVFPLSGNAASLAGPELAGVRIAVDLANADGGVGGHPIALEVRDL